MTSLVILVNRAQKQLPEERRRPIKTNKVCEQIIESIATMNSLEQAELVELRRKPATKIIKEKVGREEVLNALSEESLFALLLQKQSARSREISHKLSTLRKDTSQVGGRIDNLIGYVKLGNTHMLEVNDTLAKVLAQVKTNGNG